MISNKKNRWFYLFLLHHAVTFINAQVPEDYESIYRKTYLEISQKDFNRSLQIADSLFSISQTPYFQAKSLMLSATLLQQAGDINEAVAYAVRAEQIVSTTNDLNWMARVYGFLATQYRFLKLFDQSKKYTDKAFEIIEKINDPQKTNNLMGFMMQEKAYYELEMKNYQKSIDFINKSQHYFDLNPQNDKIFTANNFQLLGLNHYHLKDFDTALIFYNKALLHLEGSPDNLRQSLVFNGFAQIYIGKNDLEKAKLYLDKAEKIAHKSPHLSLKNEVYKTWEEYYTRTKNINKLQEVKIRQDSVSEQIFSKSTSFIDNAYSGLDKKNTEIQKHNRIKNILIVVAFLSMACGTTYFFIYRNRQQRNIENMKKILAELDKESPSESYTSIAAIREARDNKQEGEQVRIMTYATEKNLLSKLEKFEHSTIFIKSNISLPYLASYFGTNTKYLSYTINTHKKKDFKNYINELRVLYMIKKIKNDPQYRKYKISALAHEAGFSSQSKFAAAFRKVTSVSPSLFLHHLQEDQSEA